MMIDRRGFLALSAVGAAAGVMGACSSRTSGPAVTKHASADTGAVEIAIDAAETQIDLGGVSVRTWAWGGQVPGKEVRVRKGQTLRAAVTNNLPAPAGTTVHWHGLAIPNPMDGVPVLTQPPIASGQRFQYEFVVPDTGTYWMHSHVGLQLDRGLYGPLIIEDPNERVNYDDELVVVLDDWIDGTGTDPPQVFANLKENGMPSMANMPAGGGVTPTTPLGTDGGDVTYPYFLINGKVPTDPQVMDYRAGQRLRLRVINAGADTAFRLAVPNTMLNVTHTDGYPVVPTQTDSVILGMGERVDATITVGSSVPLIAAAEDKPGHAQLNLRVNGAPAVVNVDDFIKSLRGWAPLNTALLVAAPNVQLPTRNPDKTLDLRLAGPLTGYTWPINGLLYDPPNNGLAVPAGQRVRIRFINESKMFHPMHLHGHTFQVLAPSGPAARKDTVLVPPLATVEIDFDTNNPGRWITHCHNDYHLEAGMATFIFYAG
jgi:FtsP/CotA-like multicopper oxidase with cupredoxin domain